MRIWLAALLLPLVAGCAGTLQDMGLVRPPEVRIPAQSLNLALIEMSRTLGQVEGRLSVRCDPQMQGPLMADTTTCDRAKALQPAVQTIVAMMIEAASKPVQELDVQAIMKLAVQLIGLAKVFIAP